MKGGQTTRYHDRWTWILHRLQLLLVSLVIQWITTFNPHDIPMRVFMLRAGTAETDTDVSRFLPLNLIHQINVQSRCCLLRWSFFLSGWCQIMGYKINKQPGKWTIPPERFALFKGEATNSRLHSFPLSLDLSSQTFLRVDWELILTWFHMPVKSKQTFYVPNLFEIALARMCKFDLFPIIVLLNIPQNVQNVFKITRHAMKTVLP